MPPRGWIKHNRVRSFQAAPPKRPLVRRVLRFFFNPLTISLTMLAIVAAFLTAAYFWFEYSARVDLLLNGEVFTNTAGIYSAPKTLKKGEELTAENLVEYLKAAGYIEKNSQADPSRSRYQTGDGAVKIEPGGSAVIEDRKVFPALTVKFNKKGKSVETITDDDASKELDTTKLEPKILSSIAAEGDGRRKTVSFTDLPPNLVKAITATEDRAFFEHYGVNFRGIARALWRRYEKEGDDSPLANQGGSSITQQLVKNLLLNRDQTLERKAKEAYMSLILETRLSKEEIFTLYANQIYLGQQNGVSIYGVGEAANAYFGKDVSQLSLSECAFLAGIIRSPNRYNPYKNLEKVTERRNQVLQSMTEANVIEQPQAEEAKTEQLALRHISSQKDLKGMPYFSQYVLEQMPNVVSDPEALQHLRVYTTIDPDLQEKAYQIVNERLEKLDKYFRKKDKKLNAALISIRPKTGEIVAMVGGRDYLENQFNRATDARRQPGSVFKPFVYATALNSAYDGNAGIYTTASIFKDEKRTFTFGSDTYSPNNYGDFFSNADITLRDALVKSKNTITVDLGMQLNIGKVMNLAAKAGLPKVEKAYPSMALGTAESTPLQVATAYTVFANLGNKVSPIAINRVTTGDGRVVTEPQGEKKTVLRPDVAYIMDDILKDVINRGTAAGAQAWGFKNVAGKRGYAGKTGTSRDGWFAGFTPELITVVYVGFDDNDDLGMKGSDSAMPIWADFMRAALDEYPEWNGDWQMPVNVMQGEIDTRNGKLIREINGADADKIKAEEAASKKNAEGDELDSLEDLPKKEIYVTEVPPEFRRVELFVGGTMPNRILLPSGEPDAEIDASANPSPTATPFTTWTEAQQTQNTNTNAAPTPELTSPPKLQRKVNLLICDVTGMRATHNCPRVKIKSFNEGEEPKEFCNFHVRPPQ